MRIKIVNKGILFEYNIKFSGLANKEMHGHQLGEFSLQILGAKGLIYDDEYTCTCTCRTK